MSALTYRLSSGETWTLTPSPEGVEIVGELAPDGLHLILTRDDVERLWWKLDSVLALIGYARRETR